MSAINHVGKSYLVVKQVHSEFEALCLELMLSSNSNGRYVYYKAGDVSSFVGVVGYNNMTTARYIEAIKPMRPDFMFKHSDHMLKGNELWFGSDLKSGVLDSFEAWRSDIYDMERKIFRLRYRYDARRNLVVERESIDSEDHDHTAGDILERGRQRVDSVPVEDISIGIRLLNDAVQQDFDDCDDYTNQLENLEG